MKMIDMQLVQAWQNALREAFQLAFNSRYRVVDFVTDHDAQTCWYVLSQIEQ
jgi:predicted GNAT superfamily acetyltransferase